MIIGIDASSIVSSGGLTYLFELINHINNEYHPEIKYIKVFASQKVLDYLPDHPLIIKQTFWYLNSNKVARIFFQSCLFDKYLLGQIDLLFSVTGDYIGNFRPLVGMSQNMLLYEREHWKDIPDLKERAKFYFNYIRQKICFNKADGIIFLSNYARDYIQKVLSINNKKSIIIHHGISNKFLNNKNETTKPFSYYSFENPFKFLYVSSIHTYKNQSNVIEAIAELRKKKYPVVLTLIGEVIYKKAGNKMIETIKKVDPEGKFINHILSVSYSKMSEKYSEHDGIIFASTCENMPNILIESMGCGKPIACSKKLPMPQFLKEGGFYFDALSLNSIISCLENMLISPSEYSILAKRNKKEIKKYNWEETSKKTFKFLSSISN
jgi:glycosyltransferase involved in cell wall biosynthesis